MRDRDLSRTEKREDPDPIARNTYGSNPAQEAEKDTASIDSPAHTAAATPVQTQPDQRPLDKSEEQPDASIAAAAMGHTVLQPVGLAAGQPSAMAQLGAMAYQMAPHGVGEFAFAEEAGMLPPGSANPAGNPLGAQVDELMPSATFQERTLPEAEVVEPTKGLSAVDVLNLSRKATQEVRLADEAMVEQELARHPFANRDVMQLTQPGQTGQQATAQAYLSQLLNNEFQGQMNRETPRAPTRAGLAEFTNSMGIETATLSTQATPAGTPGAAGIGAYVAADAAQDNTSRMLDRIADQARWIIRNGRQEVTMKLYPEHLGDMQLKVTHIDRTMRVEMSVETLVAKQTLEANLEDLQNKLQAQNPNTENFEFNVDVRQHDDPRQSEAFFMPSRDALAPGNREQVDAVRAQEILTTSRPVWGTRGVGIYV